MLTLSWTDVNRLAQAADGPIVGALDGSLLGWKSAAPTNEPDAVAAVVSAGIPRAAAAWRPILGPLGRRADIVGIFTHCTPKVEFTDGAGDLQHCELADLLIVVDDVTGASPDRRAMLVQAKQGAPPTKTLTESGDLVQLELLSTWPSFTFYQKPYFRADRDIGASGTPGRVSQSGEYGMIDLQARPPGWAHAAPANPLIFAAQSTLGLLLARMVCGAAGREVTIGGSDPWSDTVETLLQVTFHAAAASYPGRPSRGVSTPAYFYDDGSCGGLGLLVDAGKERPVVLRGGGGGGASSDGDAPSEPGPINVVRVVISRASD
ncbi:hypothetical protein [Caulobacter soli]|uniref:hypothetical protein n=1 Tax=Caulobacter soli TaxID=2708539 RepID=UPI0013EB48E5|nr:hypothetical protein [Caulobacter soli]